MLDLHKDKGLQQLKDLVRVKPQHRGVGSSRVVSEARHAMDRLSTSWKDNQSPVPSSAPARSQVNKLEKLRIHGNVVDVTTHTDHPLSDNNRRTKHRGESHTKLEPIVKPREESRMRSSQESLKRLKMSDSDTSLPSLGPSSSRAEVDEGQSARGLRESSFSRQVESLPSIFSNDGPTPRQSTSTQSISTRATPRPQLAGEEDEEDDYLQSEEKRRARLRAEQHGRQVGDSLRERAAAVEDAMLNKMHCRMKEIEEQSMRYHSHGVQVMQRNDRSVNIRNSKLVFG
mmetsp:Transcript_21676/g.26107  ORF Transcript_21676/g.26107 Transcript_21676/m.26107 type:complete len:286 (+) Transcript_21676:149-1006(+)|eukprot:CAMPEP_0197849060 /NCGR_PEP_ID=MMETSP1438-20131217/10773_1 /TAXON_ID=1461541 /ORGANISM="Pterosperma sp., Strain CCMP1384" /LENGTH=285 /DNA_ID=CAMNT_0043461581 /DNA_START=133 /DNA_END=990 /DNA_ORIENTATION=-